MRPHRTAKGKRRDLDEDEFDDEFDEDGPGENEDTEQEPMEYSEAVKVLEELAGSNPTPERMAQLRANAYLEAQKAWEVRERSNANLIVAQKAKAEADGRWMADEEVDQLTPRLQRRMRRKTKKEIRALDDADDDYREANIRFVGWARVCDLLKLQIDADTASLGKL